MFVGIWDLQGICLRVYKQVLGFLVLGIVLGYGDKVGKAISSFYFYKNFLGREGIGGDSFIGQRLVQCASRRSWKGVGVFMEWGDLRSRIQVKFRFFWNGNSGGIIRLFVNRWRVFRVDIFYYLRRNFIFFYLIGFQYKILGESRFR